MEPGQSEAKRPRLDPPASSPWASSHQGPILPPPQPAQTHHHPALSPFQSHSIYGRQPEPPPPHQAHHHPDDRRHHEQESYPHPPPPMQDHHRQPPPSPVHAPPFPPYRRDSIVKRESGEETPLPQMRRPNSTGNAPEGLPSHPSGHPPYLGQHPEDHRRPPSFDNGASMPPSPQVYRPQQQLPPFHAPPTPIAQHTPQYDAPTPGYGPPSVSDMYSTVPVASAKRKAQRASQACDSCRQLKAKCDEQRPCKNCKDKNALCVYRDLPTKQPDKVSADILDLMSALKSQITSEFGRMDQRMTKMDQRMTKMDQRMMKMEQAMRPSDQASGLKLESVEDDQEQHYDQSPTLNGKDAHDLDPPSPNEDDDPSRDYVVKAARETVRQMDDDEIETQPGPPVAPGQPSLPVDHTTSATNILKWPSVKNLCEDFLLKEGIQYVGEFPIRQEQQRGVLRVFGRGEGFDQEIRTSVKSGHPMDQIMTDVNDDFSDVASPNPPPEAWGQVGGISPPGIDTYKGGVLNSDGTPDFDRAKVDQYVDSFKKNVLNMHPILIPGQLDAMVTVFLDTLPPHTVKQSNKGSAKFVQASGSSLPETGMKRKRSPAVDEQNAPIGLQKPGLPCRSIHSALVLSVLALGKICLHQGKIPEYVNEHDQPAHSSPSVRNGVLSSPSQGSPPGLTPVQNSGLPSPRENERSMSSRRPSLQGPGSSLKGYAMKRNLDIIPGLEYYALAADIFGSHIGGYTLKHVYVALFLGLYHGQLGRILESWSYIALAGRTLQVVIRPSLSRLRSLEGHVPQTIRDNQLAFAFWTCLQLESDILAELQVPQTGILGYEEGMPYPNLSKKTNEGYAPYVLSSYNAQLYLRKQLNLIHGGLYSSGIQSSGAQAKTTEEKLRDFQEGLKNPATAVWIPPEFRFEATEPPASDILAARLRAKYWGSQVLLYRPYVDYVLHGGRLGKRHFSEPPPPRSQWAAKGLDLDGYHVPDELDPRALNYARLGIFALVESTRAFHGLDPRHRLQVTNVFTTAHAQWGNLLVLAACHRHPVLSQFIPRELLQTLFSRIIGFFKLISHSTSPLKMDMNILIGLSRKLGFSIEDVHGRANSSFSSMTSAGPIPTSTPGDNYHPGTPVMAPPSHGMY
ncbi:uncharacterized protein JN550_011383 [Neoarthrinium moseri]|uniref:uncharacterized protein n=1 Tax=Neoarthrinium moseri TaxID=1658444 RepID=UPI001FDB4A11|nr:uncharacterized protein JN550_011383 [Neoarthrinium moseri]KAI1860658.1 hypothetical protein JN550_011383 [Neoarthrinium moseri]